mmetsp:Transcript_6620/g.13404  ORF Transcript_6620/g.13404 Transcript_6620/m.13404 type:complete len:605 (-) Transcript_6620:980-2794(-)
MALEVQRLVGILLLVVSGVQCATDGREDKIVGGSIVGNAFKYPFMAMVITNSGGIICGGSLVDPWYVVTAAHCLYDSTQTFQPSQAREVWLGGRTLTDYQAKEAIAVSQRIVHPQYDSSTEANDIALLKLATPAKTTPVGVSLRSWEQLGSTACVIVGYGVTKFGENVPSNELRDAVVNVIPPSQCSSLYPVQLSEGMMCAGVLRGGVDSCTGDSGGPLLIPAVSQGKILGLSGRPIAVDSKWELVGATSWGYGCGEPNAPGVYTLISAFGCWIQQSAPGLRQRLCSTWPPPSTQTSVPPTHSATPEPPFASLTSSGPAPPPQNPTRTSPPTLVPSPTGYMTVLVTPQPGWLSFFQALTQQPSQGPPYRSMAPSPPIRVSQAPSLNMVSPSSGGTLPSPPWWALVFPLVSSNPDPLPSPIRIPIATASLKPEPTVVVDLCHPLRIVAGRRLTSLVTVASSLRQQLMRINQELCNLSTTGTMSSDFGITILKGTMRHGSPQVFVFSSTEYLPSRIFWATDLADKGILVNVRGGSETLGGIAFWNWPHVLWNFCTAQNIDIASRLYGSILAPRSIIRVNAAVNGSIVGYLVSSSPSPSPVGDLELC